MISPIGFLPVADFYSGKNTLGDDEVVFAHLLEEKGHRDLAYFVWNSRLQHRFAFCWVDEDLEWNEWKVAALQRYKDDSEPQLLLARHQVSSIHKM
ncbi:hypothetical protein B0J13DRAFT_590558 [Dactylonectria estremocensis]|uniref:Uncharacterized protein n=1 Tax=Dactylonectria estremocensis TaxID=1079267 RepID=A0A9P9D8M1_9HYPO|nr:hypothetical protein B0J13DRAFT_590558 [Dactylonectria estremocensis]